jgi:SAM-dependent methyltransferase
MTLTAGPPNRHFDLGKPLAGRDEVTRYFVDRYSAASLLDVGCGSGPVWPIFVSKGVAVTGIDLVPTSLISHEVDGRPITYIEADFLRWRASRRYDAVYSSHTIEHAPDTERFLTGFFGTLAPGGAFCLIWPPPKPAVVSGHVHVFNMGLMLYNLVRLGVNCRSVEMVRCGYCLAIMGRYERFQVPLLTHNEGDLERLASFFPFRAYQGFDGDNPPGLVTLDEIVDR